MRIIGEEERLPDGLAPVKKRMNEGSKYHTLYLHLKQTGEDEIILTLSEIEALVGSQLPPTAYTHRAWWSNRRQGAVQATAWIDAGYQVTVIDLQNACITFKKTGRIYRAQRRGDMVLWDAELIKALRRHMGMTQMGFAQMLGVRQPTISEWETGIYAPKRSTSKLLTMIAEQAEFKYE